MVRGGSVPGRLLPGSTLRFGGAQTRRSRREGKHRARSAEHRGSGEAPRRLFLPPFVPSFLRSFLPPSPRSLSGGLRDAKPPRRPAGLLQPNGWLVSSLATNPRDFHHHRHHHRPFFIIIINIIIVLVRTTSRTTQTTMQRLLATSLPAGRVGQQVRQGLFPSTSTHGHVVLRTLATINQHASLQTTAPLNTARLVKVSHILVPETDAKTLDLIRTTLSAADAPALPSTFASLASDYSTCPSGKSSGDLGWVQVGQMVADFEDACFRSAPGDLVECSTEYGKHFIYVEAEQKQGEIRPMSVNELQTLLVAGQLEEEGGVLEVGKNVQLLDVREPGEVEMSALQGPWKVYSLSAFGTWGPEVAYMLDPDQTTVVLCHAGVRSAQVCQFLLRNQFRDLRNVTGGIAAYSRIDPSVPEY